jgi:CCR4-NOT transcription complex subunit 6
VPSELGTLYQLETLGLEGNPIQADLNNLLMKEGTHAVIVSLRENAPGKSNTFIYMEMECV